jgi:hypothetical protein
MTTAAWVAFVVGVIVGVSVMIAGWIVSEVVDFFRSQAR